MIEEKIEIDFGEYLSCFDDEGNVKDTKNAECCIEAINKAVNNFIDGAQVIAHHGLNINGKNFRARVEVVAEENSMALDIVCGDTFRTLATYISEPNLVMTKSYGLVSIL